MAIDDTKARIRAAAVDLFTTNGYDHTSLREIAERVGLTKASLYYHYPSKQALLAALVAPLVEDLHRALREFESHPYGPGTVRAALDGFLDIVLRHQHAWSLFARDTPAVLSSLEPLLTDVIELGRRINAWLAGPDPTPADMVRSIAATEVIGAAVQSMAVVPGVTADEVRRTLLDAAAAVLRLPPPAQPGAGPTAR